MSSTQHQAGRHPGAAATLLRAAAFSVLNVLVLLLLSWDAAVSGSGGGANIGAGLAFILVTVVAAAVWGGKDGHRCRYATQLIGRWAIVAVIASLVTPAYDALFLDTRSPQAFFSAVWGISPLAAAIIFVPAVVSGVPALQARPRALAAQH